MLAVDVVLMYFFLTLHAVLVLLVLDHVFVLVLVVVLVFVLVFLLGH